jgi:hypothetical protein
LSSATQARRTLSSAFLTGAWRVAVALLRAAVLKLQH